MAAPRKPSAAAFTGRTTHTNSGGFTEPVTKFQGAVKDEVTGKRHSSFPHLSPAIGLRAEHVTDVTHVATVVGPGAGTRFSIHQRFHQDNVSGAKPVHDRFIGTDSSGKVYNVSAELSTAVHQKRGAKVPSRGETLESATPSSHLSFTVDDASGDPPLSPRTRTRKTGGYF
jgi:hypothetical protein